MSIDYLLIIPLPAFKSIVGFVIFLLLVIRVEIEGSGKTWRQDQRVRLRHVDTGGYLHSHDKKYTRIAGGQQEVITIWHPFLSFARVFL